MAAFGVHFGSSSACLAVFKDGKTDVVANDLGDRTTPSMVAYTDLEQAVGMAAKQAYIRNTQNTIPCVKKVLGRSMEDPELQSYKDAYAVKVVPNKGEPHFQVEFKGKTTLVSPGTVAEAVFKTMMGIAKSHGDGDIHDSVLTVPTDFTEEQIAATSDAAASGGFNILRIIKEPLAALMAYDVGQLDNKTESCTLVFRLGGESSSVSVVKEHNGLYRIMGSVNSTQLSGTKFTKALTDYLATEFFRQYKLDVTESRRSLSKLNMAAERCKHTLSTLDNASCAVDSLFEGVDFHNNVSRARLENQVGFLMQQCTSLIDAACSDAGISTDQVDKVIVCGGGAKMPLVQKTIKGYIKSAEVLSSIPPDEIIAIGAAKQAGILTGCDATEVKENTENNEIECLSKAVCLRSCSNGATNLQPVFPSLTPLPSRKHETVILGEHQTSLQMDLCECGDLQQPDTADDLAKLVMRDLPEAAKVLVTFHLRREGSLHVTCREETSNKTESVMVEVCS
ncbi:heat shock 70 kDa protein 14-like [Mizuhopecten yessoensis]|uniref:Heat shock 70 kDa protein n=1 Tax=Mizuhopecten yessoensis TaxID=6573 RepID=A0A1C9U310_MIZYE|nr:heat shock 70 kDa protein 14-like [Mizuhopecten yessoensis]AOR17380.1 heat shock 70 kDa protein [Mizuhopecten yessoensis]OWF38450.1 Heat shock 70 kDa protein 14 [Mizuhopecten yessoensis]